jgi:hypothetical protein
VDEGLVNRVIPKVIDLNSNVLTIHNNIKQYNIDKLKMDDIIKSRDAILVLNGFRWCYYNIIYNLIAQSNYNKAKELIKIMNEKFNKEKLPFTSIEAEQYFKDLFKQADKNYR